jgi:hypothetical protein
MKALFEQLVSPEQKQLSDLVTAKGGVDVLRNNDKILLDLEKSANKTSGSPSVEGHRTCQTKSTNADSEVDSLRVDILEDPNSAAEKNWVVFSRKFEVQKSQIIDELSLVVQRESDRVVRELKGKAHERIRDRVGYFVARMSANNRCLLSSVVNSRALGRNGRCSDATSLCRKHADYLRRAGEGMSRLDILCLLFETIIWRSIPRKLKVSLVWAPVQSTLQRIRMDGQSNTSMLCGCNRF